MPDLELREISETKRVRDFLYPADLNVRHLLVTGPPGCGKTTRIRALGGWPTEGYLDLTRRKWWYSRHLTYRPREIHLGLPFAGYKQGLALFDREWLDADPPLQLEVERICLPRRRKITLFEPRNKYVFEFLLPPADTVYDLRDKRRQRHTHPVDAELSLIQVERQLEICERVAHHLHRHGFVVIVRDALDGPPKMFTDPQIAPEPRKKRMRRASAVLSEVVDLRLAGSRARLDPATLPLEIRLGTHRLWMVPESMTRLTGRGPDRAILLIEPEVPEDRVAGFRRLQVGDTARLALDQEGRPVLAESERHFHAKLRIGYRDRAVTVADLHSPSGLVLNRLTEADVQQIGDERKGALATIREIYGGPLRALEKAEARDCLAGVQAILDEGRGRPQNDEGRPGGIVEIPDKVVPVIVGDLHANLDNLLTILTSNGLLRHLDRGTAALIFLGDAVHREDGPDLEEMESSVLVMDLIWKLMLSFPNRVFYLRGNHDSFSHEVTKEGLTQGVLWRKHIKKTRGKKFRREMERFYESLPYVAVTTDFIACHAGPPRAKVTRKRLVNIAQRPELAHEITWNRLQSRNRPGGYGKGDIRALRKALSADPETSVIVSHNPPNDDNTAWRNLGEIENHHLVYSAHPDKASVFTRINRQMVPLELLSEPLSELLQD